MTALSIWGPYALRRSVNKFSSSALGKINKFLLHSLMRRFQHTPKITIPKVSIIPMVGTPKKNKDAQRSYAIAVDIAGALSM